MRDSPGKLFKVLFSPTSLWALLREYFSFSQLRKNPPINDRESLKDFLTTRASFVAQTSLYGYLRTRAGMRYPELFDDDVFVVSINIAKWQIWLACLSDLAIFAGGRLRDYPGSTGQQITELMQSVVAKVLSETGVPEDAGDQFSSHAKHLEQRISLCDWQSITDDEKAFSHSPQALVDWAPIVDDLKKLDEEIVINSVRFRWQKVRQDFRKALDLKKFFNEL